MFKQYNNNGFMNTSSGNLNSKQISQKYKQLDISDFDISLLNQSSNQIKTLKKPLKQIIPQLTKTNPTGVSNIIYERQQIKVQKQKEKYQPKIKKNNWVLDDYRVIQFAGKQIQPAYKSQGKTVYHTSTEEYLFNDKNTIISALMRKGIHKDQIKLQQPQKQQKLKQTGPAQRKLKALFNKKQATIPNKVVPQKHKQVIDEQINQQIDQYGNQSFEKMSGAYESIIKQSIIGASSGLKQSIRQDIKYSIRQSIGEQIPQFKQSVRQSIRESINQSHRKSKQQQVYEDIFQQQSLSGSASKSRSQFKKKSELLDSQSKSFRMKQPNVVKSIKIAEDINFKQSIGHQQKLKQQYLKGDKMTIQILKQKTYLTGLKDNIQALLKKKPNKQINQQKNKQLLYRFKIQFNRLLTSHHFESKLKKLTDFIHISSEKSQPQKLEDKILKNLMDKIKQITVPPQNKDIVEKSELQKLRKQYDEKLNNMMKIQSINLRAQMNDKMAQKDLQLKKIIAELEQKMLDKSYAPKMQINYKQQPGYYRPEQYEIDSDESIDNYDIDWKMDLWSVLPDYQKKRLYQKQTDQVTKFLTQIMMKQIKQEAMDRSLDISFQFPKDLQSSTQSLPTFAKKVSSVRKEDDEILKPAFSRKQLQKDFDLKDKKYQFPQLPKRKQQRQSASWNQQVIPKLKDEGSKKDNVLKTQIIKTLKKYKDFMIKKKNDIIRKIVKVLMTTKNKNAPINSLMQQVQILNAKDIKKQDLPFVRAYQQCIMKELVSIYNKYQNRKASFYEEEMKKIYDRLTVTCQVQTAEICSVYTCLLEQPTKFNNTNELIKAFEKRQCPIQIIEEDTYFNYKLNKNSKDVKNQIVNSIVEILSQQFAKQFPKKR